MESYTFFWILFLFGMSEIMTSIGRFFVKNIQVVLWVIKSRWTQSVATNVDFANVACGFRRSIFNWIINNTGIGNDNKSNNNNSLRMTVETALLMPVPVWSSHIKPPNCTHWDVTPLNLDLSSATSRDLFRSGQSSSYAGYVSITIRPSSRLLFWSDILVCWEIGLHGRKLMPFEDNKPVGIR